MLAKKIIEDYSKPNIYIAQNSCISNSITQAWTQQAIECYEINSDCNKCSITQGKYSFVCQMPKVIGQLLETVGKPVY
jgi:hypothetical protein